MVSQFVSHYRIVKKLGAGGMGEVYLAEDSRLNRQVAIKLLPAKSTGDEQARKRLLREAQAAARLDHPNICAIHEVGQDSDTAFIVMQYIEGESLAERMHSLKLDESIDLAIQVADALSQAHTRGIVHRDIKPQNVIVSPRGQAKVLDFGLAKRVAQTRDEEIEGETVSAITEAGVIVGTAAYMSPEQARSGRIDERSDLFSLGAMLYEMTTGRRPFAGSSLIEVCAQVLHVDPPPPSEINPRVPMELERVIMKALAKNPSARYQSAEEMMRDLKTARSILDTEEPLRTQPAPGAGTSPVPALRTMTSVLKRPRVLMSAASVIVGAILIFWFAFLLGQAAPHQPSAEAQRWADKGTDLMRDGSYYQASKCLERAVEIDGEFALARLHLAEAFIELDYTEKAKDELLRVPDPSKLSPVERLYHQAITRTVTYDFAGAVEAYSQIVELSPEAEKAYALLDLGRAQERNRDWKKALESYEAAKNLAPQYAAVSLRLGVLYGRQREDEKSDVALAEAEKLYQDIGDLEGVAEVCYQRGVRLIKRGKTAKAREELQRAIDIASRSGNTHQKLRSLLQMSSAVAFENNILLAQTLSSRAIEIARAEHIENLSTGGLIDLGNTFYLRGHLNEAEKCYKQALEFAQLYKGRLNEAWALLSLASLYTQHMGKASEAREYASRALEFYRQGGYGTEVSQAWTILGHASDQTGDYEAALEAFHQQLQLAEQAEDKRQRALSHEGIATVLAHQENYPEALKHYEKHLALNREIGQQILIAHGLANCANMLWRMGRYEEARKSFDEALSIASHEDEEMEELLAWIHVYSAEMALSQNQFRVAEVESKEALRLAGTDLKEIIVEAKRACGLALALSGKALAGKLLCEESLSTANQMNDPRLIRASNLALARVVLEDGDAKGAMKLALEAYDSFERARQMDSAFRALLIAAIASRGDEGRDYRAQADALAVEIGQKWGGSYLDRRDIRSLRGRTQRFDGGK